MTHKDPHEVYNIFLQVAAGKENRNPSYQKELISTNPSGSGNEEFDPPDCYKGIKW